MNIPDMSDIGYEAWANWYESQNPRPRMIDIYLKSDLFKEDCKLMDEIFKNGLGRL